MIFKAQVSEEEYRSKKLRDELAAKELEKRIIEEEEARIKALKDKERNEIEMNFKKQLDAVHQKEIEDKEAEKRFIEQKLREGEEARKALQLEKQRILEESEKLLELKLEEEAAAKRALAEEAEMKLNNQEKEYQQKLKEENARRVALETIKANLEGQKLLMEENMAKREEEEIKLRALEERIRGNQVNRLKTLEAELQKRDAQFDEKKREEIQKLRKAEEDRVRRSIQFKNEMLEEQKRWDDITKQTKTAAK